jgi:hypothetical protein
MSWRRPSRLRRALKWAGVGFVALTLAAGAASFPIGLGYVQQSFDVRVVEGIAYVDSPSRLASAGYSPGWHAFGYFTFQGPGLIPAFLRWPTTHSKGVEVPLGPVVLILAVATALLFWTDRRPPKGHCRKCGYNLTGNVSGVCSECGQVI